MYSPKEGGQWEGGGKEKLLLLEGNKNTAFSVTGLGKGLSCSTGPGRAATRCDSGRAPLRQTTIFIKHHLGWSGTE